MKLLLGPASLALLSTAACLAQNGSISGSVLSVTGEPLRSATLRLGGGPQAYSTNSDAQGNFSFTNLDSGSYGLCSQKAGYLDACADRNPLGLASGQSVTGILIKMPPQALISGRVADDYGDPYPNAAVSAMRWGYSGGTKHLQAVGSRSLTNGDGGFTIGGLAAGSYYVQVTPRRGGISPPAIQKGPEETFVTTYYPGVTDASSAVAVQVTAGAALRGVEIRMHMVRAYRIRGQVTGGESPASVRLTLNPNQPSGEAPTTLKDNIFDFEAIVPGSYEINATSGRPPSMLVGRQIVTVSNADVDDLVLQLRAGAEITGKIEGLAAPPPQPVPSVNLYPLVGSGGNGSQASADGTFTFSNIQAAVYRVDVQRLPPGTYVSSIRFEGQDVLHGPLDLTSGAGGSMTVVLSPNAGDFGGTVRGADGTPRVALVSLWRPGAPVAGVTIFFREVNAFPTGQFSFAGVPPGEYRIATWEDIDYGLDQIPDFRIQFDDKAATVKVDEKAHVIVDPPLIPRDAIEAAAAKL